MLGIFLEFNTKFLYYASEIGKSKTKKEKETDCALESNQIKDHRENRVIISGKLIYH